MAERIKIEVDGVKQTLRALNQIDPEQRKQFNRDARLIAKPIMDNAKQRYTRVPLSGFNRRWTVGTREITPRTIGRYRSGVSFSVNTSKKRQSVFTVLQRNAAASVFDMAGRKQPNQLSRSLEAAGWGTASRVMWPAAEAKAGDAIRELMDLVDKASRIVQRELERR